MLGAELPSLLAGTSPAHGHKSDAAVPQEPKEATTRSFPSCATRWAEATERFAHREALIFDGLGPEHRYDFADLDASAQALARSLQHLGVDTGDRVVTVAVNRPELVALLLSCFKLGATFVPLSTDLRLCDCQTMVAMYEPTLIICDQPQFAPFLYPDGRERPTLLIPSFQHGSNELQRMMITKGSPTSLRFPHVAPDVPTIIFSTSGSTGKPKGVVLSDRSVSCIDEVGVPMVDIQLGERLLLWVSMRGVAGTLLLWRCLLSGSVAVMVDTYPSGPAVWGDLIEKHSIEANLLFGAAMNQMLQELPEKTFPSVKSISYGGSCFSPALVQNSMRQFPNARFRQLYGMTEVFPISSLAPEDHVPAGMASRPELLVMSSAGQCVFPENVFVEDLAQPGSGLPPPPDQQGVGQICARSTTWMMTGYYGNLEKTREAMPDGKFIRTGDVGKLDEAGYLHILGRVKDIIPAYKGFNVAPRDVEEVLYAHQTVAQAAVVGIWHPSGAGEAVVAWVSSKAGLHVTADELRAHCKQSRMPDWQMPDAIYVLPDSLPEVGSKIAYSTLREPEFRQAALAADLVRVRASLCAEGTSSHQDDEDQKDTLAELFPDGTCSGSSLAAVFGESWSTASEVLSAGSGGSSEEVLKSGMSKLLALMGIEDRASFILGIRSLQGNWAAGKMQ